MLAELVLRIQEAKTPAGMPVTFVAIDGHGGSGKSTLAQLLARELQSEIIHTDDFAFPNHQDAWVPILEEKVFKAIKNGVKTLSYQPASWWPEHNPDPVVGQRVTKVMILEGVSSSRKIFRPYLAYSIWVDAPKDVCLRRGLARDKDQGTKDQVEKLWEKWFSQEEEYIKKDDPKNNANIIVDGTKNYA